MMHPVIQCAIKAQPILNAILAAVKQRQWVLQGHETGGSFDGDTGLVSNFGRTIESRGGMSISLESLSGIQLDAGSAEDGDCEDKIGICFHLNGSTSSITFTYLLPNNRWFVEYFSDPGSEELFAGIDERLKINSLRSVDRNPRTYLQEEGILDLIAMVANHTFDHCDEGLVR